MSQRYQISPLNALLSTADQNYNLFAVSSSPTQLFFSVISTSLTPSTARKPHIREICNLGPGNLFIFGSSTGTSTMAHAIPPNFPFRLNNEFWGNLWGASSTGGALTASVFQA